MNLEQLLVEESPELSGDTAPEARRGAVGEIATGLERGAVVQTPTIVGQGMRWFSEPGAPIYEAGESMRVNAEIRGENPDLKLQPEAHGPITNSLSAGAEMLIPSVGPQAIAVLGDVLFPPAAPALHSAAAGMTGILYGASQAQSTYENVLDATGDTGKARVAGMAAGVAEGAGEAVASQIGGKYLTGALRALGPKGGKIAERVLAKARNPKALVDFGVATGMNAATEVATEMGQNASAVAIEQAAGVTDGPTPWGAAKDAISPTLGLSALMLPFGGVGSYRANRQTGQLLTVLEDSAAPAPERSQAAAFFYEQIAERDRAAADTWAAETLTAISEGRSIVVADGASVEEKQAGPLSRAAEKAVPTVDPVADVEPQRDEPVVDERIAPLSPAADGGPLESLVEAEIATQDDEVVDSFEPQQEPIVEAGLPIEQVVVPVDEDLAVDEQSDMLEAAETPLQETIVRVANTAATSPENNLPEPTEAQKEAGNYKKGHVRIHGLDIAIENPRGSERKGVDPTGDAWAVTMPAHYGYVKRTEGADGDHVDVYIGKRPESENVFVVDQLDIATGNFDEHKVVLGVDNVEEATELYVGGFSDGKGRERIGAMVAMPIDEFKGWLRDGDQRKPVAVGAEIEQPVVLQSTSDVSSESVVAEDVFRKDGSPFPTARAAKMARTVRGLRDSHELVEVDGGFTLRGSAHALPKVAPASEDVDHVASVGNMSSVGSMSSVTAAASGKKDRLRIDNTRDNIIVAIKKLGGIDRVQVEQQAGKALSESGKYLDKKNHLFGAPVFRAKNGKTLDMMREALVEEGYLAEGSDINDLLSALSDAVAGNPALSTAGEISDIDIVAEENKYLESLGLDVNDLTEEERTEYEELTDSERLALEQRYAESLSFIEEPDIIEVVDATPEQEAIDEQESGQVATESSDEESNRSGRSGERSATESGTKGQGGTESGSVDSKTKDLFGNEVAQPKNKDKPTQPDLLTAKPKFGETKPKKNLEGSTEMESAVDEADYLDRQGDLTEDAAPAPGEEQALPREIDDFGEKISGARKDLGKFATKEQSDDDIASLPLSKIWPKSEVDKIEDVKLAAVATAIRSEIPSKPRKSYAVASWVKKVQTVKSIMAYADEFGYDKLIKHMRTSKIGAMDGFANRIELLAGIPRESWSRIGELEIYPTSYRFEKDGTKVPSPFSSIKVDGTRKRFADVIAMEDIIANTKALLTEEVQSNVNTSMKFEVRSRRGTYFISRKGDSEYRQLISFDSLQEARDFKRDESAKLDELWEAVKDRDNVKKGDLRSKENKPRTGKDHREGKDVTAEQFTKAFGFRGVQFGKWVKQGKSGKDRQGMLNQAYDALYDLANLLSIPSEAISLNGKLGLAFGARGHGAAMAHYEPMQVVINLTKTNGAGSLAHEWFHALDHYFGNERQWAEGNNKTDNMFVTHKPEPMYVLKKGHHGGISKAELERRWSKFEDRKGSLYDPDLWHLDPKHPEGVRPIVEAAFANLIEKLNESPMKGRSRAIDKGKADGYWSRTLERAARSFENYVIDKMMKGGYDNDFLANVTTEEEFGRNKARYPYLTAEELGPVSEAFDALFGTIETKETDSGVALFSISGREIESPAVDIGSVLVGESGLGEVQVTPTQSLPFIRNILEREQLDQVLVRGGNVNAVRQVAKSFGKTVVFFRERGRDDGGLLRSEGGSGDSKESRNDSAQKVAGGLRGPERADRIGGFVYPSQPNKIFLNVDSQSHILFTLGHELGHTLRMDDEQLWKQMAAELKPLIRKWSEYQSKLDDPRYAKLSELEQTEELFGDLIGHNFLNELFWQDIAELNPTLFKKLARRAIALLNKALQVLTGHNVSRFVSDIEQTRAILAKTLLDYGKNVAAGKYAEYAEQHDASYVGERIDGHAILQRLKDAGVSEDVLTKAFAGMRLSVEGGEKGARYSIQVTPSAVDKRIRRMKKAYQDAKPRVQHTIDYLRMKLQDKYLPLQRVQDALEGSGWAKTEENDARLAEELYHSKVTLRLEEFYEDVVQPLVDAVKDSGVTIAELEDYLYARFAPQRNAYIAKINPKMPDGGSGMGTAEASAIIEQFKKDDKIDILEALEMEVRDVTQMQRDIIRASGLELDDTMDAWEYKNPFYVPLKGGKDDSKRKTIGVGANISRSGTQQALGRDTRATDLLAHLFEQVGKTIERSERAKIGRAFLKMVKENRDENMWKVYDPKRPETMPKKRKLVKNVAAKELERERDELVGKITVGGLPSAWKRQMEYRLDEIKEQIEKAGTETVQSVVDYSYLQNDNILSVTKDNGDVVYIEIHDADLSRVMQGQGVAMNKALQVAGSVTRFLSQMNTMFNPEFLITNFERDVQTALIHVGGEHNSSAAKKVAKSIFPAMKGIHNATRGDNSSDWADWYHRYRKAGGQISFMDLQGAEHWQRKLKNMSGEGGVMHLTRANLDRLGNFVGDYNTIVENATRLAAFKVCIESGMSEAEAASVSRNLTVNFNKKGELGPAINALYMFANAGVQGSARIFGAMKHKRVQKIAGAGVMLGVALAEMGRLVGGDDEDDENRWDKVSEFTKQTNMIFTMPDGDIVKIRMPYGYNVFVATGYAISDFVHGKSLYETVKFMTSSVMNAFNPLGGDEGLLKVLSPTFTDPLLEIATNENFMGSKIRPDNFAFGAKKPDSQLYFRSVSTASKAVTGFLNDVTGGSKYEPGAIDISPETIDHLFSFIVGGTGRTVGRVVDMPIKAAQGDLLLKDVPYLRQMYETKSEYVNSSRFYENTERVATLRATLKELPLSERSVFFRAHPEVKMFKLAGKVARRIAAYRRRYYHYIDSGDKQKAAAVKKRMEALFLRFNKSFNSVSA